MYTRRTWKISHHAPLSERREHTRVPWGELRRFRVSGGNEVKGQPLVGLLGKRRHFL